MPAPNPASDDGIASGPQRDDAEPVQGFSPAGQLLHLMSGYWVSQALHTAAELGLADAVGRKPRDVDALAQALDCDADALYRLLRALASVGVFTEAAPRAFATTPMAVLLRRDMPGNLRDFCRFQGARWHWQSWGDLVGTVRSGIPAIRRELGATDCFDYLASHPEEAATFDAAMSGYAARVHAAIVDEGGFDDARLIVDVGGGRGELLARLLEAVPAARGIVLDRAPVVAGATQTFARFGVQARAQAVAGDFFDEVPAGGDLYLLSNILHDWPDAQAIALLRRIRAAMADRARVLIVEHVIAPGDAADPGKLVDLEMMVIAGGRERTEAEFRRLADAAGLHITAIRRTATAACIVEARPPGAAPTC